MIDGFALGPLFIRFYGIILMLGAVAGGWLATVEMKRRGHDPEMVWDLLVYLIIGGVIGARLWHIFTPPPSSIAQGFTTEFYLTHPLDAVAIWKGGLGIPGVIMGGLVALWFYTRNNKAFSFLDWADIAGPSLALGQAIGRWGNFFNQELYGPPTNLPWGIAIDCAHRIGDHGIAQWPCSQYPFETTAFQPLFLYESASGVIGLIALLWLARRFGPRMRPGDLLLIWFMWYAVVRFWLETFREGNWTFFGVPTAMLVSSVTFVVAGALLLYRHRPGAAFEPWGEPPVPAEDLYEDDEDEVFEDDEELVDDDGPDPDPAAGDEP